MARLKTHGAKPPGPREEEFTPLNSPDLSPLDPRIERNRFGTISLAPKEQVHAAPAMSLGGRHLGEGFQRVSVLSVEFTLGGKHAKAGSQWFSFNDKGQASRPKTTHNKVTPALPRPHDPHSPSSSSDSSLLVVELVPQKIKGPQPKPPALVLGERYAQSTPTTPNFTPHSTGEKTDAEGDTPMENTGPVSLPVGAPTLKATDAPVFGDFSNPTEYSVAPSSAFEIATPPPPPPNPAQGKGKGKGKATPVEKPRQHRQPGNPATSSNITPIGKTTRSPPDPCKVCGNIHSNKCRYREEDRCEVCRRFHSNKCRYRGEERCEVCRRRHFGVCTRRNPVNHAVPNPPNPRPQPQPQPRTPPRPPLPVNPVTPKAIMNKYHFIGTGKNCPAVTPTRLTKAYWRDNYNRTLQGSGVHVERVEVDPRLPRERVLTVLSKLGEIETRTVLAKNFIKEQVFEKIFKEKEYPEVVVKDYVVQGGHVTSTQVYGVMERLRELNPGLKMGPRYPAFLARRNEPAKTAPLRICLDSALPEQIQIDTLTGEVVQAQCLKYTRMNRNQGRYKEGEYYEITHNDISLANHEERHGRWAPHGDYNTGLEIKCHECGRPHEGPCRKQDKEPQAPKAQYPPYGKCYICGNVNHWANLYRGCPRKRRQC